MNPDHQIETVVDVAVGIIRDASGRVLVNQRPAGKPFSGKWEFPGGKIDEGESVEQALARELDEELGIVPGAQRPLITIPHRYDDLEVRLHVNEVLDYRGEPAGLEGQALEWVAPADLARVDLLEANDAIVRAVVLPRLCLITDTARFGVQKTLERLAGHAAAGRVLVIVREKAMARAELEAFVAKAGRITAAADSMLCVHHDCDIGHNEAVDGIHMPANALEDVSLPAGRGLVGVSCHTETEVEAAANLGADYALLSPVNATTSHPEAEPLGWQRFKDICAEASIPVYALGGMTFDDQDLAFHHGGQGTAILSAAWL